MAAIWRMFVCQKIVMGGSGANSLDVEETITFKKISDAKMWFREQSGVVDEMLSAWEEDGGGEIGGDSFEWSTTKGVGRMRSGASVTYRIQCSEVI